jgi:hypothetical protein
MRNKRDGREERREMRDERQEGRKRWTRDRKAKWFTSKLR